MADANRVIRQRYQRSLVVDCPSAKVPIVDTSEKIDGTELVVMRDDEDFPSTMSVLIPKSEKMIGSNEVIKQSFFEGVVSTCQLFLSQSASRNYKLHYEQAMAFLCEDTSDETYVECGIRDIKKEYHGGHAFILAADLVDMFLKMQRYSYSKREIYLLSELRRKINHSFIGTSISAEQQLHITQNQLWYLMSSSLPQDANFKRKLAEHMTLMDTLTRLVLEQ